MMTNDDVDDEDDDEYHWSVWALCQRMTTTNDAFVCSEKGSGSVWNGRHFFQNGSHAFHTGTDSF